MNAAIRRRPIIRVQVKYFMMVMSRITDTCSRVHTDRGMGGGPPSAEVRTSPGQRSTPDAATTTLVRPALRAVC